MYGTSSRVESTCFRSFFKRIADTKKYISKLIDLQNFWQEPSCAMQFVAG